jgi:Domain of unknown function (DUF4296)
VLNFIRYPVFLILLLTFFVNCSEEEALPEDEFIKVYVGILIAQDTVTDKSISTDSLKTIILAEYGVSDSVYKKTVAYYNSSPDKWEEFFDKAILHVEKLKSKEKD